MSSPFDLEVTGLLLRQGRHLNRLSMGLLGLTGVWLVVVSVRGRPVDAVSWAFLGAGVAAGLLQVYLAMRVDFDAELLIVLAERPDPDEAAATLDASLVAAGLMPADGAGREWPDRLAGARGLLRRQAAVICLQLVLCLIGWLTAGW